MHVCMHVSVCGMHCATLFLCLVCVCVCVCVCASVYACVYAYRHACMPVWIDVCMTYNCVNQVDNYIICIECGCHYSGMLD